MGGTEAGKPGPKVAKSEVGNHAGKDLYDQGVLRTLSWTSRPPTGRLELRPSTTPTSRCRRS